MFGNHHSKLILKFQIIKHKYITFKAVKVEYKVITVGLIVT